MSKENDWAEERDFYIEYGFINCECKNIPNFWALTMHPDWDHDNLNFSIHPKIQALIDVRNSLKKENEVLRRIASPNMNTLYYDLQNALGEIAGLKKDNDVLRTRNTSLEQACTLRDALDEKNVLQRKELQEVTTSRMKAIIDLRDTLRQEREALADACKKNIGLQKENVELEQEIKELIIKLNHSSDNMFYWHNQAIGMQEEAGIKQHEHIKLEALFDQYACAALTGLVTRVVNFSPRDDEIALLAFEQATECLKQRANALKQLKNDLTHQPKKEDV